MFKTITDSIASVQTIAVSLIGLSIVLEVVFGSTVPFLSLGVINNISGIVADLGSQGFSSNTVWHFLLKNNIA